MQFILFKIILLVFNSIMILVNYKLDHKIWLTLISISFGFLLSSIIDDITENYKR